VWGSCARDIFMILVERYRNEENMEMQDFILKFIGLAVNQISNNLRKKDG
jgi:hypothetical protein